MSVKIQDEGEKERGALGRHWETLELSVETVCKCWSIFIYLCLDFSDFPPVFFSSWFFSFLGDLCSFAGGFDSLVCWLCMEPTGFTTKGGNPAALAPKALNVMGAALQLDSTFSPYEFV